MTGAGLDMATVIKNFFIAASPEKVWDALCDFHAWPTAPA
jgi:hypothetical protein